MEKKELTKQFLAAVFFLTGIFLVILFVFTIGSDKGFSQPKFQIRVLFNNVGGLTEGAPALLSGVNVGNVASIDFLERDVKGKKVQVTINILTKYRKQLEKATQYTIKTEGILGEKLVEIYSLEGQQPADFNQFIIGEEPIDVGDLAIKFSDAAQAFTKTAEELNKVDIVELTDVMVDSSRALLITAEGLNDIMDELQQITRKSKRMFDRLEQQIIEGSLFKVF
ncbi:MAG TPA: MlaD family protein [Candidatus Omnitrophota bacterium]|nr:MlaD family protein [Candidatus Omnitrophota bacterium]